MKKLILIISALLFWTVLLQPATAAPLCPIVTNLTPATTNNHEPHIDGDYVVWNWYDNNDWEIVVYQISTQITAQLTNNDTDEWTPLIGGDYVVWEDNNSSTQLFHIGDINGPVKLADNATPMAIAEGYVVYYTKSTNQLMLYTITANNHTLLQTIDSTGEVNIDGDYIVWSGRVQSGTSQIYLYQISTTTLTPVTNTELDNHNPRISGDHIAWRHNTAEGYAMMVYTISTTQTTQIGPDIVDHVGVYDIGGDHVVWSEEGATESDLFLYTISTNTLIPFTNTAMHETWPFLTGDYLVYSRTKSPEPASNLMLYDFASGQTTQITRNATQATHDDRVFIWNEMGKVYMSTCDDYQQKVVNPSFETDNNKDAIPDQWTPVKWLGDSRLCNVNTTLRGFLGRCAFRFMGGLNKKSMLQQRPSITGLDFTQPVTISAWVQGQKVPANTAKLVVRVYYTDTTSTPTTINLSSGTYKYKQFVQTVNIDSGKTVSKVLVQLRYFGKSGSMMVDGVYLSQPTPGPDRTEEWLPLPSAN